MFHRSPFPLSDMHPSTAHLLLPHSVSPSPSSVGQGVLLTHLKNLHLQKLFRSTVPSARLACRCRRAADAGRVEASVPLERPAIAVDPWSEDNGNNMLYTNRTPLLTPVERDADIRNHPSKKISLMEPGASDSEVYRDEFEVEVQHQETSVSSTVDEFSLETHGMTMSEDTEETAQGSKASLLEAPLDTGGRRHPSNRRQVSATGRAKGFWQIVENDTKFIKGGLKWMKEEALPSLTENMEKIVTMRMAEDPSVAQTSEPPFSPSYYPGLSGVELMMADAVCNQVTT